MAPRGRASARKSAPRSPATSPSPARPAKAAAAPAPAPEPMTEFGGPVGSTLTMALLPLLVGYVVLCLQEHRGQLFVPESVWTFPQPSARAALFYAAWLLLQVVLALQGPGLWRPGQPLADGGGRLQYHLNGWFAFCATVAVAAAAVGSGAFPARLLADMAGELFAVANLFSIAASVALYAGCRLGLAGLRADRCTGNVLYDLFHGASLNPRLGDLDLKFFCEGRPGLLLWMLLSWSCAARQAEEMGACAPSAAMGLVVAFHTWYVADYFYGEEAILTTRDIMHDKFGFMLLWGDLVWVPFTFALQEQVLLAAGPAAAAAAAPAWLLATAVAVNGVGYWIFRSSNAQKHAFRSDPASATVWGKAPEFVATARGTKLLASGWWGLARHPNYLGDWLMGLAWCLPCGLLSPLAFFYAAYFGVLLVHRERRDHEHCAEKYGADWDRYCERVPRRIVPGVY